MTSSMTTKMPILTDKQIEQFTDVELVNNYKYYRNYHAVLRDTVKQKPVSEDERYIAYADSISDTKDSLKLAVQTRKLKLKDF
jgi:hypothetical protein